MKEQILAVQRMQDYIEAHLEGTIGLSDLAQVSLFSPWHSHRLFQEYTGLTPASYIRRLRLAKAALRLKKEDIYIIDVAFDLGFGSVDGFTRAFYREFGMCPRDYAINPVPITLFVPYGAKFRALRKERTTMKTNNIFIQIIHKPARKVLCKRGIKAEDYFPYCEEDYCDAIMAVQQAMDGYDPTVIGYTWDDHNPRIQLEPRGNRGYIELRAVRRK